jgi:hypothetical protein
MNQDGSFYVSKKELEQELHFLAIRVGLSDRHELVRRVANGEYYGKHVETMIFHNLWLYDQDLYNWCRNRRDIDNDDILHGRLYS